MCFFRYIWEREYTRTHQYHLDTFRYQWVCVHHWKANPNIHVCTDMHVYALWSVAHTPTKHASVCMDMQIRTASPAIAPRPGGFEDVDAHVDVDCICTLMFPSIHTDAKLFYSCACLLPFEHPCAHIHTSMHVHTPVQQHAHNSQIHFDTYQMPLHWIIFL